MEVRRGQGEVLDLSWRYKCGKTEPLIYQLVIFSMSPIQTKQFHLLREPPRRDTVVRLAQTKICPLALDVTTDAWGSL
jgi:hypothetical protein